jgi:hypothetical protein
VGCDDVAHGDERAIDVGQEGVDVGVDGAERLLERATE